MDDDLQDRMKQALITAGFDEQGADDALAVIIPLVAEEIDSIYRDLRG